MDDQTLLTFIRTHTRLVPLPFLPEITLHLSDESWHLWKLTQDLLGQADAPPFWAFAWPGGQALARYLLDHPDVVRGRSVFDLASGSGLVAIAAAKAGAASVLAGDIDPLAAAAIHLNAAANSVNLSVTTDDLVGQDIARDVLLAGDVFYERAMACRVLSFLQRAAERGVQVLIGDPGRDFLPRSGLQRVAEYDVPVSRAVEDAEWKHTAVLRLA